MKKKPTPAGEEKGWIRPACWSGRRTQMQSNWQGFIYKTGRYKRVSEVRRWINSRNRGNKDETAREGHWKSLRHQLVEELQRKWQDRADGEDQTGHHKAKLRYLMTTDSEADQVPGRGEPADRNSEWTSQDRNSNNITRQDKAPQEHKLTLKQAGV